MRIVVMGSGGVGGYFGGQLAKAGHEVVFVARGAHLAALQERGLAVESSVAPLALPRLNAIEALAVAGPVDVVMFCVKLWGAESAAHQLSPVLAKGGVVIPFQNGVESHVIRSRALGAERVAGGVAHIAATIRSPGVIAHTGSMARLRVGSFSGERRNRCTRLPMRVAPPASTSMRCPKSRARSGRSSYFWWPLNDLSAGRPLEAPWLAGAVARMGNEAKIAVPVNATSFAALKPWLSGVPPP